MSPRRPELRPDRRPDVSGAVDGWRHNAADDVCACRFVVGEQDAAGVALNVSGAITGDASETPAGAVWVASPVEFVKGGGRGDASRTDLGAEVVGPAGAAADGAAPT